MMAAWSQRHEALGLLCMQVPRVFHTRAGDVLHGAAIRSGEAMCVHPRPAQWRTVPAMVLAGVRVACVLDDMDDADHVARRLLSMAPHLQDVETAVWDGQGWTTRALSSFV